MHNIDCGNSYKSLTKGNYRNNALKYKKTDGQGLVAHHKLPQQFRTQFEARGINIDSPVYMELLDPTNHTAIHKAGYNPRWSTFFQNNPNATYVDIMKFAGLM